MAQSNWRWCHKCQGLFFGPDLGVCPAGGAHDIGQSLDYLADDQPGDTGEHNWRWCHLCSGLFFAGNATTGWCPAPAAGGHNYRPSGDYSVLQTTGLALIGFEPNWRWCHRCQGLFLAANRTSGCCPAGGGHDYTGSAEYLVRYSEK